MTDYIAHLADATDLLSTFCGEPWQGWQAPEDLDLKTRVDDPRSTTIAPHSQPRPHQDRIRQCQACARLIRRSQ